MQGPQASALLAQFGADVVKVELPFVGDQARWLPAAPGETRSAYFSACNRGKRSVTIDLRSPDGQAVFHRLAATADVVISNFKPGTMDAWGLGDEALRATNPGLVYATGSAFGAVGPDAEREGADLSAQAAGGLISATGRDGGEVTPIAATIADHLASQHLAAGSARGADRPRPNGPRPARGRLAVGQPDLGAGQRVHGVPALGRRCPGDRTAGTR